MGGAARPCQGRHAICQRSCLPAPPPAAPTPPAVLPPTACRTCEGLGRALWVAHRVCQTVADRRRQARAVGVANPGDLRWGHAWQGRVGWAELGTHCTCSGGRERQPAGQPASRQPSTAQLRWLVDSGALAWTGAGRRATAPSRLLAVWPVSSTRMSTLSLRMSSASSAAQGTAEKWRPTGRQARRGVGIRTAGSVQASRHSCRSPEPPARRRLSRQSSSRGACLPRACVRRRATCPPPPPRCSSAAPSCCRAAGGQQARRGRGTGRGAQQAA